MIDQVAWRLQNPPKKRGNFVRHDLVIRLGDHRRLELLLNRSTVGREPFPIGHQGDVPIPLHPTPIRQSRKGAGRRIAHNSFIMTRRGLSEYTAPLLSKSSRAASKELITSKGVPSTVKYNTSLATGGKVTVNYDPWNRRRSQCVHTILASQGSVLNPFMPARGEIDQIPYENLGLGAGQTTLVGWETPYVGQCRQ